MRQLPDATVENLQKMYDHNKFFFSKARSLTYSMATVSQVPGSHRITLSLLELLECFKSML